LVALNQVEQCRGPRPAGQGVPDGALAVSGSATGARVVRLLEPPRPLPVAARWTALLCAGLLLLLPTALLVLPAV
jgi:hypothetical protein